MKRLGKYEILEELGKGGFGVVYKARDLVLDRFVALKLLHRPLTINQRFTSVFIQEARHLARVVHPNVVYVYEVDEAEGRLFIAMQYLAGGSLEARIQHGPMALRKSLVIISQVARGLDAGHNAGIIHRDVKPGNILFSGDDKAVISDFGVARAVELSTMSSTGQTGGAVGTPFYRPPELWHGKVSPSPATDVYSLTCVLYEMLTGNILFSGETPNYVLTRHVLESPSDLIGKDIKRISRKLVQVFERALEKEPSKRYQCMGSFVAALKTVL